MDVSLLNKRPYVSLPSFAIDTPQLTTALYADKLTLTKTYRKSK